MTEGTFRCPHLLSQTIWPTLPAATGNFALCALSDLTPKGTLRRHKLPIPMQQSSGLMTRRAIICKRRLLSGRMFMDALISACSPVLILKLASSTTASALGMAAKDSLLHLSPMGGIYFSRAKLEMFTLYRQVETSH